MEDKMAAGAFGRARNYGWGVRPLFKSKEKLTRASLVVSFILAAKVQSTASLLIITPQTLCLNTVASYWHHGTNGHRSSPSKVTRGLLKALGMCDKFAINTLTHKSPHVTIAQTRYIRASIVSESLAGCIFQSRGSFVLRIVQKEKRKEKKKKKKKRFEFLHVFGVSIDTFNNDVIRGKALKSVSCVLNEFSQIVNIEPKLTTYWHKRGEQLRNEVRIYDKSWRETASGAHLPERPSTLYPWSNLFPDWAIFRNVFPANFSLHCGPYMTEINAEKKWRPKRSPASFVRFPQPFPFPRWFRSYADRSGDRRSRETILKIAQSGHRLSLRLSMGDGRSGWWAPDCFHSASSQMTSL